MRKIVLTALAMALVAPAGAALADNDAGCGLGTQIWEGHSGLAPKVAAATTNSIGSQTIAMSSGTLGCSGRGTVTAQAQITQFASANMGPLAAQMASGNGEALNVLASLYGIHTQKDKRAFFAMTQHHFGQIFATDHVTTGQVLTHIHTLMMRDAQLRPYAMSV